MRFLIYILLTLTGGIPSAIADSVPLLYTRSDITIMRHSMPALPWKPDATSTEASVVFDTEIRDGATLYNQQGWYNLNAPEALKAVMLVFGAPVLAPIIPSASYAPIDIVLIDKEGTVLQIFPRLRLAALEEEIYPAQPVSAFLFLKGGSCEALSIAPGDYVVYKIFKRPPKALDAPINLKSN